MLAILFIAILIVDRPLPMVPGDNLQQLLLIVNIRIVIIIFFYFLVGAPLLRHQSRALHLDLVAASILAVLLLHQLFLLFLLALRLHLQQL